MGGRASCCRRGPAATTEGRPAPHGDGAMPPRQPGQSQEEYVHALEKRLVYEAEHVHINLSHAAAAPADGPAQGAGQGSEETATRAGRATPSASASLVSATILHAALLLVLLLAVLS